MTETVAFDLLERAGTAAFKAVSKLVLLIAVAAPMTLIDKRQQFDGMASVLDGLSGVTIWMRD